MQDRLPAQIVKEWQLCLVQAVEEYLSFDKTDREYSLAPTDGRIRFGRSKVKVIPWFQFVVAKASHWRLVLKFIV